MSHNVMVLLEIQKREYKKARTNRNGISIFETKAITAFCGAQRPQMRFRAAALRSKTATRLMQVISC